MELLTIGDMLGSALEFFISSKLSPEPKYLTSFASQLYIRCENVTPDDPSLFVVIVLSEP